MRKPVTELHLAVALDRFKPSSLGYLMMCGLEEVREMAVQQVIALVVAGLLFCCFPSSAFSESPDLGELEAKVRRFEARAPKGPAYDRALLDLYNAYVEDGRDVDAVSTMRKLWRLREKELGLSDDLTISAMQTLARDWARDDAGIEEALRILDQALNRVLRLPKRRPASEVSILEDMAEVRSRADPDELTVQIEILERQTDIIERHRDAFDRDGLLAHRQRITKFMDRIPEADAILRPRAQAVGRRAWLAHEAFVVNRWEAYRRSKQWAREEAHPAEALAEFYSNQFAGKNTGGFFSWFFGSAAITDELMDPQSRAARALEVLPRVVDAELKLARGKPGRLLLKPLSAIVDAAAIAGPSAPRESLATAARLWLAITVESSGRYSDGHLEALNQVVAAYEAASPGGAVDFAAEQDTVSRALEAGQGLQDALRALRDSAAADESGGDAKTKLRTAVERCVEAFAKDGAALPGFMASQISAADPQQAPDAKLEVMKTLFDVLGPESRGGLAFASEVLGALVKSGRTREAFLLGMQIAPRAERTFGLQDALTQSIITEMLFPALRFAGDADRQALLDKSERMEVRPDESLIRALLDHGAPEAALRMTWRKINTEKDDLSLLKGSDYELIAVLGKQADLAAFADKVEARIAHFLDTPPDPGSWIGAEGHRYLRSLRGKLLDYPRTLRGACEAGARARNEMAVAREQWLKQKAKDRKPDFMYAALALVELQIERAAMDCFVRSNRPSSAVSLLKSSQPVTASAMGPVKLSANPVTALRTALTLASASDWAAAEGMLKRLMDDRKASADKRAQEFARYPRGGPPGSWEGDAESSLFDELAARQYAPGIPASRLLGVSYLKALWRAKGSAAPFADVDRAFRLAQRTELGIATAIAKMAARGVGGPELGERVRKLEDLQAEETRLSDRKIGLVGHDDVGERLKKIAAEIAEIEAEIAEKFPRYYELIRPNTLGIREVQKLLAADEALVLTADTPALFTAPEETFIGVVTKKDFRWVRSALGTDALTREVSALRCGLDDDDWATKEKSGRCNDLLGLIGAGDASRLRFHLGKSHALYKELFGQVEALIAGKRLMIVPSGALTSLPFGVLVTERPRHQLPDAFEQYFDVAWLAARNALVTLPAISSLKSLREQLANQPSAPDRYAGYGNPVLAGGRSCGAVTVPTECPSLEPAAGRVAAAGERAILRDRSGWRSGNATIDYIFRRDAGPATVLEQVRALCPLPDTQYEISCVAARFKENARLLRFQAEASEQDVKSLSQSGELARYGILHFATHGLLSGDVQRITNRQGEPALVLTPPEKPESADDDGLLMASEVTALKLNADWVVLSACNTAAGEKIGAEALSGLARSFFYAGARSLLVSHWPAFSSAAVRLSTSAFAELDRDDKIGRAEALQRAMIALMQDRTQSYNAHPAVWAPFVLVGESRRSLN